MKWLEFNAVTGRILQWVSGSSVIPPEETDSLGRLDDADPAFSDQSYITLPARTITARPATTITSSLASNVLTLSNVALGTVVIVTGDAADSITQDATDGAMAITFDTAGTYTIFAENFPELPFTVTVSV